MGKTEDFKKAIRPHKANAAITVDSIDNLITAHDALLAIGKCREEHSIVVSDLDKHAFKGCKDLITRHTHLIAFVAKLRSNDPLLDRVRKHFRAFNAVEAFHSPKWWPKDAQGNPVVSESDQLKLQLDALHKALGWVESGTAVATWSREARGELPSTSKGVGAINQHTVCPSDEWLVVSACACSGQSSACQGVQGAAEEPAVASPPLCAVGCATGAAAGVFCSLDQIAAAQSWHTCGEVEPSWSWSRPSFGPPATTPGCLSLVCAGHPRQARVCLLCSRVRSTAAAAAF